MAKNAKIERSQKLFLEAMKKKFAQDEPAPITKTPQTDHVTLIPRCKPDPFDEEADRKYDLTINSRDDWEMKGFQRK